MQLRELYYLDNRSMEPAEDGRYNPEDDKSIVDAGDTRKTRLTLRDINRARRADDMHKKEKSQELSQVQSMYGLAAQQPEQGM